MVYGTERRSIGQTDDGRWDKKMDCKTDRGTMGQIYGLWERQILDGGTKRWTVGKTEGRWDKKMVCRTDRRTVGQIYGL